MTKLKEVWTTDSSGKGRFSQAPRRDCEAASNDRPDPAIGSSDNDARTPGRPAVSHRTGDEQGEETSQALKVAQPQDSEVQPVVLASTPVLWVVSISSIVAGWFWGKKRERRQRSGGRGGNCHSSCR